MPAARRGLNANQYAAATVAPYRLFPPDTQRVPLLQASLAIDGGRLLPEPAYDGSCATQQVWSGRGVCPLADGGTRQCW